MKFPRYDAYELSPVVEEINGDSTRTCEPYLTLAEAEAACGDFDRIIWSLYGHLPEGGVECIGDFDTFEYAASVYSRITGCSPPEDGSGTHFLPAHPQFEIRIEVSGGMADLDSSLPPGVSLVIWDHDNEEATPEGEVYEPLSY